MEKPLLHSTDPLAIANRYQSAMKEELAAVVNHVGERVIVGYGTTLWGGKASTCKGIELHDDVRLFDGCRLVVDHASHESGIILREKVACNFNVYLEGSGGIEIGAGTIIGPNAVIVSSGHVISEDVPVQESGKHYGRVIIGQNVWIGANAVIVKGVVVGHGAVIGAGSVVTKDVPNGAKVAGNPARPISKQNNVSRLRSLGNQLTFTPGVPMAHSKWTDDNS